MKKNLLLAIGIALAISSTNVMAAPTDSTMTAPELSAEPAIDGSIDAAWDAVPFTGMNKVLAGVQAAPNYEVKFKLGWKGSKLFLLVDITDDVIVISPSFAMYKQDYAMPIVHFKPSDQDTSYNKETSFWYRINLDNSRNDGRWLGSWTAPSEGVRSAAKTRTGGAVAEFSFDATKFEGPALANGTVIGFNLETGDNDDPATEQRTSQLVWATSSTGNDWANSLGEVGMVTLTSGTAVNSAIAQNSFEVYPNPAVDVIRFSQNVASVKVYNMAGAVVRSAINVSSVNVKGLNGMYFLKATSANGNVTSQKIVVR